MIHTSDEKPSLIPIFFSEKNKLLEWEIIIIVMGAEVEGVGGVLGVVGVPWEAVSETLGEEEGEGNEISSIQKYFQCFSVINSVLRTT